MNNTFQCEVITLSIEPHPDPETTALEIGRFGDYQVVVQKGRYMTGDKVVYIPEAAILPQWIIVKLGLEGKLSGTDKNRVKAIKLRGILSEGLILPLEVEEE